MEVYSEDAEVTKRPVSEPGSDPKGINGSDPAASTVGPGCDVANNQMVTATLAGAALGALAGAVGGNSSDAATGAVVGTALGAGAGSAMSSGTAWTAQRRYDIAYQQCLYAKGNVIPGYYPQPVQPLP